MIISRHTPSSRLRFGADKNDKNPFLEKNEPAIARIKAQYQHTAQMKDQRKVLEQNKKRQWIGRLKNALPLGWIMAGTLLGGIGLSLHNSSANNDAAYAVQADRRAANNGVKPALDKLQEWAAKVEKEGSYNPSPDMLEKGQELTYNLVRSFSYGMEYNNIPMERSIYRNSAYGYYSGYRASDEAKEVVQALKSYLEEKSQFSGTSQDILTFINQEPLFNHLSPADRKEMADQINRQMAIKPRTGYDDIYTNFVAKYEKTNPKAVDLLNYLNQRRSQGQTLEINQYLETAPAFKDMASSARETLAQQIYGVYNANPNITAEALSEKVLKADFLRPAASRLVEYLRTKIQVSNAPSVRKFVDNYPALRDLTARDKEHLIYGLEQARIQGTTDGYNILDAYLGGKTYGITYRDAIQATTPDGVYALMEKAVKNNTRLSAEEKTYFLKKIRHTLNEMGQEMAWDARHSPQDGFGWFLMVLGGLGLAAAAGHGSYLAIEAAKKRRQEQEAIQKNNLFTVRTDELDPPEVRTEINQLRKKLDEHCTGLHTLRSEAAEKNPEIKAFFTTLYETATPSSDILKQAIEGQVQKRFLDTQQNEVTELAYYREIGQWIDQAKIDFDYLPEFPDKNLQAGPELPPDPMPVDKQLAHEIDRLNNRMAAALATYANQMIIEHQLEKESTQQKQVITDMEARLKSEESIALRRQLDLDKKKLELMQRRNEASAQTREQALTVLHDLEKKRFENQQALLKYNESPAYHMAMQRLEKLRDAQSQLSESPALPFDWKRIEADLNQTDLTLNNTSRQVKKP